MKPVPDVDFNRDDTALAEEIFLDVCPSERERKLILGQLLRSIAAAERVAPLSVSCTPFGNGFRLNVGNVEALTFFDREVRLFLHGAARPAAEQVGELQPCTLKSAPQPSHVLRMNMKSFQKAHEVLAAAHEAYVRGGAVTPNGKPRKSSFARYNSPGLLTYAAQVTGAGV
jgi:hypothetical protein